MKPLPLLSTLSPQLVSLSMQAVRSVFGVVPCGQAKQYKLPASGCTVPAGQSTQASPKSE
jgi:hypothetical protein